MAIFQHIVEFNSHDGIGNDIKGISEILQDNNKENYIVTLLNKSLLNEPNVLIYKEINKSMFSNKDIHILHYGGMGYPINFFCNLPGKKILRFHNITPYFFSYGFCSADYFKSFKEGYEQSVMELQSLCFDIQEIWYDSYYNMISLKNMINFHFTHIKEKIKPIFRKYHIEGKNINHNTWNLLFIGRIVPHKKIEDIILLLYYLNKISTNYKLHIIGSFSKIFKEYEEYLLNFVDRLNLKNNIIWHGNISEEKLQLLRKDIGFYISMSEHEGFCIPILESYGFGIPVLAYDSCAVRETMGSAGVKISQKNFPYISELLHTLSTKKNILSKIIDHQYIYLSSLNLNSQLQELL